MCNLDISYLINYVLNTYRGQYCTNTTCIMPAVHFSKKLLARHMSVNIYCDEQIEVPPCLIGIGLSSKQKQTKAGNSSSFARRRRGEKGSNSVLYLIDFTQKTQSQCQHKSPQLPKYNIGRTLSIYLRAYGHIQIDKRWLRFDRSHTYMSSQRILLRLTHTEAFFYFISRNCPVYTN